MVCHIGTCKLETERLLLRRFEDSDAEMVFNNWTHDEEVTRYVAWPTHRTILTTLQVIQEWKRAYHNPRTYQWAIVLKENQEVIGSISIFNFVTFGSQHEVSCEFGYCLSKKYWNHGLTTEAAREVLKLAFEVIGVSKVRARHDVRNFPSGRVMQKLGMNYERLLKRACQNGRYQWIDCDVYYLHKDDYFMFKEQIS